MARRLAATVHVVVDGRRYSFLAGEVPPAAAARLIVNPAAWADGPDGDVDGDRPAQGDPKADWVDHAVAQGVDRGVAEGMTKAELVDRFGG